MVLLQSENTQAKRGKPALRLLRDVPVAAFVLSLALSGIARPDVVVRFDPPDLTVDLGDLFTLDIVADISDPVIAWGLDLIVVDAAIVSTWPDNALLSPPVIGPEWVDPGYTLDGDRLSGLAFPTSVSGSNILLATVTVSADQIGETDLLLGDDNPYPHESPPNDLTEGFGLDPTGFAEVTYEAGHVTVIPEPASWAILVLGGLMLARRRSEARRD